MKINHAVKIRVSAITRGSGHKAVAAAAYRSSEKLHDSKYQCDHDYSRKGGTVHSDIAVPENAPAWLTEKRGAAQREELWNEAERAEDSSTRRKQAVIGKGFVCILPRELNEPQQIALMEEFAAGMAKRGLVADWSLHQAEAADGEKNPHAHLAITTRLIDKQGFGKKWEPAGAPAGKKPRWAYLDDKNLLAAWRIEYAAAANHAYEAAGLDVRATEKGYEELGLDQKATAHKGKDATALEKQGEKTRLAVHNRKVAFDNNLRPYDRAFEGSPSPWAFEPPASGSDWHKRFAEWHMLRTASMAARDATQKSLSSVTTPPETRSLRNTERAREQAKLAYRQSGSWSERTETSSIEKDRGR